MLYQSSFCLLSCRLNDMLVAGQLFLIQQFSMVDDTKSVLLPLRLLETKFSQGLSS